MSEHPQKPHPGRRNLIKLAGASLLLSVTPVARAALNRNPGVLAVRVWPADDYTRVTIELGAPLKFSHFIVKDPERLVVDLFIDWLAAILEIRERYAEEAADVQFRPALAESGAC